MRSISVVLSAFALLLATSTAFARPWHPHQDHNELDPSFHQVIQRVVAMPGDRNLQRRSAAYGLNVVNLT